MAQIFETVARWALPVTIAFSALQTSMYNIEAGHRGVIFDRINGVLPHPKEEGTHLLIPWLQRVIPFDVRITPRNISTTTGSKDMQTVSLTLRVLHRPDVSKLHEIYSRLGMDYEERVLPSIGNEVLKAIVAQFDASELITQREQVNFETEKVSNKIRAELLKRSSEFNIVLEDVSITHLTFGKEFTEAVEQKVIGNIQFDISTTRSRKSKVYCRKSRARKTCWYYSSRR